MVNSVQAYSSGSDEASNSLQLSLTDIILKHYVIGKVNIANRFDGSLRMRAWHWTSGIWIAALKVHGVGDWTLVELHSLMFLFPR